MVPWLAVDGVLTLGLAVEGVLTLWLAVGACVALLWLELCVFDELLDDELLDDELLDDELLDDELLCAVPPDEALLCVVSEAVLVLVVDPWVEVLCVVVLMLVGIAPPSSRCGTIVSLRNFVDPDVSLRPDVVSELLTDAAPDAALVVDVVLVVLVVRVCMSGLTLRLLAYTLPGRRTVARMAGGA